MMKKEEYQAPAVQEMETVLDCPVAQGASVTPGDPDNWGDDL